jgi:hypothetical protein
MLAHAVAAVADDDDEVLGLEAPAAVTAWATRLRPPTSWSTFGVDDFIRVPSPAASTTTAAGRVRLTRGRLLGLAGRGALPGYRPGRIRLPSVTIAFRGYPP